MITNDLIYALDPVLFAAECLSFNPDSWQKDVLRTSMKRVILNCSRQAGKSTVAAIMALHRIMFYDGSLVLLISPSLRQSSELFKKVTEMMKNLPHPPKLVEDNKLSLQLRSGSRIVSLPGDEANIRGYSKVDLIIEDEAARVSDDLYRAIRPMLAVSKGSLMLISTPFGKNWAFLRCMGKRGRLAKSQNPCHKMSKNRRNIFRK